MSRRCRGGACRARSTRSNPSPTGVLRARRRRGRSPRGARISTIAGGTDPMSPGLLRRHALKGLALLAAAPFLAAGPAAAQDLKGGQLRVAILAEISNFDPQQFLTVNFPLIKNLYDSLLEYSPDGKAVPSLATAWTIAPDNTSVTL